MNRRPRLMLQRMQVPAFAGGASGVASPSAVPAALAPVGFVQPQIGPTWSSPFPGATPGIVPVQTSVIGPFQVEWCTTDNDGVLFEDHAPFWRVTNSEAFVRASGYTMTERPLEDIGEGSLVFRDSWFSPTWYVLTAPNVAPPVPGRPFPPSSGSVGAGAAVGGGVVLAAVAAVLLLGGES